jgi:ADP-ribose pyrophosphatase YjhB (NUDIX family)
MHSWIQNHILLELTLHQTRRYSELRPRDVEGNLFMYHLKGLVQEGLVVKENQAYTLSDRGLRFIGTYSLKIGRTRQQPKILTAVVAKNENDEYLFTKWGRQPNIGQISFPHGMMHYGEGVENMAAHELAEKAGLEATFNYIGDIYVRGMQKDIVDRHMLVHIFRATNVQDGTKELMQPEIHESFWAKLEDLDRTKFVPGFFEIATIVQDHENVPLFEDIVVDVTDF